VRTTALVFLTICSFAQSQPRSPTPPKVAQNQQQGKDAKRNVSDGSGNTISSPLVSPFSQKQSSEKSSKQTQDSPSNWWLIIPTIVIAVATAVQVWVYCRQTEYARRGLGMAIHQARTANISALAAKKSAELSEMTLKLTQRADILVDACYIILNTRGGSQLAANNNVEIVFKNFGPTRAENVIYKISLEIPDVPQTDRSNGPCPLGPRDTQTLSFIPFGKFLTDSERHWRWQNRYAYQGNRILQRYFWRFPYPRCIGSVQPRNARISWRRKSRSREYIKP
jgi:hypothetical protein